MNSEQCKMARAALGISTHDLAALADVGRVTVVRCEAGENIAPETRDKLRSALVDAGVVFREGKGRVSVTVPEQFAEHANLIRSICAMMADAKRVPTGAEKSARLAKLTELRDAARSVGKVQGLIAERAEE